MAQNNVSANVTSGGRYTLSDVSAWPAERWAAIVVIGAFGLLVLLRMGFRGVSVFGASASLG